MLLHLHLTAHSAPAQSSKSSLSLPLPLSTPSSEPPQPHTAQQLLQGQSPNPSQGQGQHQAGGGVRVHSDCRHRSPSKVHPHAADLCAARGPASTRTCSPSPQQQQIPSSQPLSSHLSRRPSSTSQQRLPLKDHPLPVPIPRKPKTPNTKKPVRYSFSFMADTESLESTLFDAIILGTGFTQTIVAAALARAGKSVLHLDENDYYGGASGAFAFRDLLLWADKVVSASSVTAANDTANLDKIDFERLMSRAYSHLEIQIYKSEQQTGRVIDLESFLAGLPAQADSDDRVKQVEQHILDNYSTHVTPAGDASAVALSKEVKEAIRTIAGWAVRGSKATAANFSKSVSVSQIQALEELFKASRKYNFDLAPKLLYSRGPLTNLLISSGIGKYLEFKLLERTAVYESTTDKVEMMPTSKEDVFVSKALSLKEKRQLMKFLQFAVDYENQTSVWEDYKDAPFIQFVQSAFGLRDKVLTAVVYAIGFDGNDEATTTEGLKSVKVYLQSLGRYGNSAYLCPLYGVGSELAQAFCRVAAVYGGIYMLQHGLENHIVNKDSNQWQSVVDQTGKKLQAKQLICSREYLSKDMDNYIEARTLNRSYVSHAILVTDRSAFGETMLCKTLFPMGSLVLNPGETPVRKNEHTISVLQLCAGTMSCPSDRFILYVWVESDSEDETAKEELTAAIRKLVHIPGDPHSLKAPAAAVSTLVEDKKSLAQSTEPNKAEATAESQQPSRMSLDQELDMEQIRQEILQAEKRLFEEADSTPVPSRPSTPGPNSTKSISKMFQKSKSAASLLTTPVTVPVAQFSLFYKRTTSWPRVPYPIGSEKLQPLPENVTVVKALTHSLDFEAATEEARLIFEQLCPDAEFLPPTPEPEDHGSAY